MLFSLQAEILKRSQVEEQSLSASLPTSKEEYVLIYSTIYWESLCMMNLFHSNDPVYTRL